MTVRIDQLEPGAVVVLRFATYDDETAVFLRMEGEGVDRVAHFLSVGAEGKTYEWGAYRMGGRWVYGSSGDRLTVDEIVTTLGRHEA